MVVLSAAWIALLVVELLNDGLAPTLDRAVWLIWGLFILDSAVRLLIAPDRLAYLRSQWLTLLSLALPALRILRLAAVFRFLRAAGAVRSVGLLRVVSSLNRGFATLGQVAERRGLGYVLAATALVIVVGAAAMTSFERGEAAPGTAPEDRVFADYAGALWWTASTMTTGPTAEPRSPEGRIFGWLLSVYGLAVFGYLTATLASHFIEQDRGVTRDLGGRNAEQPVDIPLEGQA
jgi:voltage-gated potassium channel